MRKVVTSIAAAIVFFAAPAAATNGIRMIGFGPVQDQMGGVGVGAALDSAVTLTNPAGMADMGGRFDLGATLFGATVKYRASDEAGGTCNPLAGAAGCMVLYDNQEFTSDRGPSPVPAFGLIVPINDKLRFGIGAWGVAGLGTDWAYNIGFNTIYSHYSQLRFTPAISYKINEMFSVGATLNVMYADLGYSLGSTALGQLAHTDTSSFGIGGTFSAQAKIQDLTIAAAYETQGAFQNFKYNLPGFTSTLLGGAFPATTQELQFDSPQTATIGASFDLGKALLIAADVQWINWAGVLGNDKPAYTTDVSPTLPFDLEWKDQWVYKVGIQWKAANEFALRVGYNYGKMPINQDKALQDIAFPAIAEHHITAGIGWSISPKVVLTVGGMYSPEAKASGSQTLAPLYPVPITYQVTMAQWDANAGISVLF
jgi:long-chain fatty acid transport protein